MAQNNLSFLVNESFYRFRYLECVQSPVAQQPTTLQRTSMAQFGGPINPHMVLGAFATYEGETEEVFPK